MRGESITVILRWEEIRCDKKECVVNRCEQKKNERVRG